MFSKWYEGNEIISHFTLHMLSKWCDGKEEIIEKKGANSDLSCVFSILYLHT